MCALMVFQIVSVSSLSLFAAAGATGNSLYNSSNIWEEEYLDQSSSDNYGYRNSTSPDIENGVLKFERGDGIRLNWANIEGFDTFDANKTYTFTFDVKVTDFGTDVPFEASAAWNRELYFAPGGYFNQIEFRSGNYSGQLGLRAGDNSAEYPKGGWNNDLSTYKLNTTYSCTVEWKPSEGKIISTVKNGDTIVVQGARTNNDYKTYNKYTRSFVWRCEDGVMELDNVTLSDGTTTFTDEFNYTSVESDACIYSAALEETFDTDVYAISNTPLITELASYGNGGEQGNNGWNQSVAPELLSDGSMLFTVYSGMSLYWENIEGFKLSADKTYSIRFDAEILSKGNGTDLRPTAGWKRELYFGYGGYYNQVEFNSNGNGVRAGDKVEGVFDNGGWNGDKNYALGKYSVEVIYDPVNRTVTSKIMLGDTLIAQGRRSGDQYVTTDAHAKFWTWRCEGGSYKLSNIVVNDGTTDFVIDPAKDFSPKSSFRKETARKTNATAPTIEDGVAKFDTKDSMAFYWLNVNGTDPYSANATYTFEFDLKVTAEGNGATWDNPDHTRILYVAFGGWFDQVHINNANGKVRAGESYVDYSSDDFLNKTVHISLVWDKNKITTTITGADGSVIASGSRTNDSYTMKIGNGDMTHLVLRCEDGAFEIDNFKFFANDKSVEGAHTRDESKTVGAVAATCKTEGYTGDTVCKYCDRTIKGTVIPVNDDHAYGEWIEKIHSGCKEEGILGHYHCSVCEKNFDANYNELTSLVIDPGHVFEDWVDAKDNSCTEDGNVGYYYCPKCEGYYDEDLNEISDVVIKATHNYGEWIDATEATCTEDGNVGHLHCADCGRNVDDRHRVIENVIIPASHKYGEWVEAKNATCTEDGIIGHYHCSGCDKYYDAEYNELQNVVIGKKAHNFGSWIEAKDATCTENGELGHYTCDGCNKNFDADHKELFTIVVDAAHTLGEWIEKIDASCTEDGTLGHFTCTECEKNFDAEGNEIADLTIAAKGHTLGDWSVTTEPTTEAEGERTRECADCNYTETERIDKLPAEDDNNNNDENNNNNNNDDDNNDNDDKVTDETEKVTDKATDSDKSAKSGCGGIIAATAVVMTSILALSAAVVAKKKED